MPELPDRTPAPGGQRDIYSVTRLNTAVKRLLETSFAQVWVEGEISNLSIPASGHAYFSLKDSTSQVRCALFRNRSRGLSYRPRDGDQILARARVSLYPARGDYQLIVDYLEDAGEGALRRALDELKKRLAAEGLFDARHKRPLPRFAHRVGVITSPTGAAVRDIITTFRRRFPVIPLIVYPVSVQGDTAAGEIVRMLELAERRAECDVLILARGGGSLEDLRPFNDEAVARAIHRCAIPVVTGVGHEIDVSICDLVADQRAATPTAAAELASPDRGDWLEYLRSRQARAERLVRDALEMRAQRLDGVRKRLPRPERLVDQARLRLHAAARLLHPVVTARIASAHHRRQRVAERLLRQSPQARLERLRDRFAHARQRLVLASYQRHEQARQRMRALGARLHGISPMATLERGYALVTDAAGNLVRSAAAVAVDSDVTVRLGQGHLGCRVREVHRR